MITCLLFVEMGCLFNRFVLPMAPPLSIRSCRLDYGGVIDNETKQFDDILETAGIVIAC